MQHDNSLASMFSDGDTASSASGALYKLLLSDSVTQIVVNDRRGLYYSDKDGIKWVTGPNGEDLFATKESYMLWIKELLGMTHILETLEANNGIIEGSFYYEKSGIHGSVHIVTDVITRRDPAVTIRKQPDDTITLDTMLGDGMLSYSMKNFLDIAVKGRANILISGGGGVGKTTLARALSRCIDPNHRVVTIEEINELYIADRLPNVVSMTTFDKYNSEGILVDSVDTEDLVREALRMRADRIWIGETRGREAYALVKACNSGHDGSCTTIHADGAAQAIKQLVTYTMEAGVSEEVAREQVSQAFSVVVHMSKVRLGRRIISEIVEVESVREGNTQRVNSLFKYNHNTDSYEQQGQPTGRLLKKWAEYGANYNI